MTGMTETWAAVTGAVDDLGGAVSVDLPALVSKLEVALSLRGFDARIEDRVRMRQSDAVEIVPFEPRYRDDFKRLNVEWLERYFHVEPIDRDVLSNPETMILTPGGQILLARYQGEIVGTCALIRAGRTRIELSKMAVTARCQGLGIGRRLLVAAIEVFQGMQTGTLFLESSSRLTPALTLYESCGFRHAPRPRMARHYARSDVYMVYDPAATQGAANAPTAARRSTPGTRPRSRRAR